MLKKIYLAIFFFISLTHFHVQATENDEIFWKAFKLEVRQHQQDMYSLVSSEYYGDKVSVKQLYANSVLNPSLENLKRLETRLINLVIELNKLLIEDDQFAKQKYYSEVCDYKNWTKLEEKMKHSEFLYSEERLKLLKPKILEKKLSFEARSWNPYLECLWEADLYDKKRISIKNCLEQNSELWTNTESLKMRLQSDFSTLYHGLDLRFSSFFRKKSSSYMFYFRAENIDFKTRTTAKMYVYPFHHLFNIPENSWKTKIYITSKNLECPVKISKDIMYQKSSIIALKLNSGKIIYLITYVDRLF